VPADHGHGGKTLVRHGQRGVKGAGRLVGCERAVAATRLIHPLDLGFVHDGKAQAKRDSG
jgi:hypothetical protein